MAGRGGWGGANQIEWKSCNLSMIIGKLYDKSISFYQNMNNIVHMYRWVKLIQGEYNISMCNRIVFHCIAIINDQMTCGSFLFLLFFGFLLVLLYFILLMMFVFYFLLRGLSNERSFLLTFNDYVVIFSDARQTCRQNK
jgi:predicted PurR-regulated permease PerM